MAQYLSDSEVDRIAGKLLKLLASFTTNNSESGGKKDRITGYPLASILDRTKVFSIGGAARKVYETRRKRDNIFGQRELFGEPAWEMLLDLAVAEEEGSRLSVSSVCIGSCAPPSTALRYIKAMETSGLVARVGDVTDARRSYVRLTKDGARRVGASLCSDLKTSIRVESDLITG